MIEQIEPLGELAPAIDVVTLTVALSVFLHGMSAVPLATAYGHWFDSMETEHEDMTESTRVHEHDLGRSAQRPEVAASGSGEPPRR